MALLAEELVEEWLNRQGYFTIRGIKVGVHEMDLLAIRLFGGEIECRHVEVQCSVNPVSYMTQLSKEDCKLTGRGSTSSATRSSEELARSADQWIAKKFQHCEKVKVMNRLATGSWSMELVVHRLKHEEEVVLLEARGIKVHRLDDLIAQLSRGGTPIQSCSGGNLLDLVFLGRYAESSQRKVSGAID
jgi:hypothetical protein